MAVFNCINIYIHMINSQEGKKYFCFTFIIDISRKEIKILQSSKDCINTFFGVRITKWAQ